MTGFAEAFAAHKAGRLTDAERGYRTVLASEPRHADAWHLLGVVAQHQGRLDEAFANISKALALRGPEPMYLTNLGLTLAALGRHAEAEKRFREALALAPAFAPLHNNLATTLKALSRPVEAEAAAREALRLDPGHARAHYNLGVLLKDRQDLAAAAECFRSAIRLAADFAEAHANLALVLHDQGDLNAAIAHGRRAVALNPKDALAFSNLGAALREAGHADEAMDCYRQALALDPDLAAARHNEGVALERTGRSDEALARYRAAGRGGLAEAALNTSLLLLARGDFIEGWKAYDARWAATPDQPRRDFPQAEWRGETEGTVLVWGEQGLGDQVLYSSMIGDLQARGQDVVLETEPRLVALFARSFPGARVIAARTPADPATLRADIRWQAPIADLGRWLRPTAAHFPARSGYLVADPLRRDRFRSDLARLPGDGPIVGLSWVSRNAKIGRNKSPALADWLPLLRLAGLRFVDLQYGDTAAERADLARADIQIHHVDGLDLHADIDGVAALAAACDFVISVSSVTAHLAAATGTPTWVLVPAAVGNLWYWMATGDHTPWYPSVRVFRQASPGDWSGVLSRVTDALLATREGKPPLQHIN